MVAKLVEVTAVETASTKAPVTVASMVVLLVVWRVDLRAVSTVGLLAV